MASKYCERCGEKKADWKLPRNAWLCDQCFRAGWLDPADSKRTKRVR